MEALRSAKCVSVCHFKCEQLTTAPVLSLNLPILSPAKMLILHTINPPWLLVLLLHLALSTAATPLPASLALRQDFCSNAPATRAGTWVPHTPPPTRHLYLPTNTPTSPLPPRRADSTTLWCTPGSSTSVRIRRLTPIVHPLAPNLAISGMLATAYAIVTMHAHMHDGVIPAAQAVGGVWQWNVHLGLALQTWNANNHQMTWGVLGAALLALQQYMEAIGYGTVTFDVMDGANWVGSGRLS